MIHPYIYIYVYICINVPDVGDHEKTGLLQSIENYCTDLF